LHREQGRLATLTATQPPGRFGRIRIEGDCRATSFDEHADNRDAWINGGFFVLEPGVLDYIEGDDTMFEQGPLARLAADDQLRAYKHDGFWLPMDTLRDRRRLEALWESGEAPWKVWQ
jgi:glucose-1-phosphate cytidylyltransferase